jgi:Cu-Zn family superoxide dismutase
MSNIRRTTALATAAAAIALAGGLALSGTSQASSVVARATLTDGAGNEVGEVRFQANHGTVIGDIEVALPVGSSRFHGFHLHANGDPANGVGCVAPAFTSADGHWNPGGAGHGNHAGDLPPLLLGADGVSRARFDVGHFAPGELHGLAVIVHAGPDNLGNIPSRYSAGGIAGPDAATLGTGDAGARYACGVVAVADL